MSAEHLARFQDVMFSATNEERLKKVLDTKPTKSIAKMQEELKNTELDFHVEVGTFCFLLHQSYDAVMGMPLWVYTRM